MFSFLCFYFEYIFFSISKAFESPDLGQFNEKFLQEVQYIVLGFNVYVTFRMFLRIILTALK